MLGTRRIYVTIRRHTVRPETILYGSRVLYDTCTPPPVNNLGPRPTQLIIYQRSFHPDILIFPRLGSSFVQKRKGRRREGEKKKFDIWGICHRNTSLVCGTTGFQDYICTRSEARRGVGGGVGGRERDYGETRRSVQNSNRYINTAKVTDDAR